MTPRRVLLLWATGQCCRGRQAQAVRPALPPPKVIGQKNRPARPARRLQAWGMGSAFPFYILLGEYSEGTVQHLRTELSARCLIKLVTGGKQRMLKDVQFDQ